MRGRAPGGNRPARQRCAWSIGPRSHNNDGNTGSGELIALGALAVAVVAFLITHRRRAAGGSATRGRGRRALSASEVLTLIPGLRDRRALWPEILQTLNPCNDKRIATLLHEIRGPHMFDPRTALGVIETGCREVNPLAHSHDGLAAAVESMNRVVGFGR